MSSSRKAEIAYEKYLNLVISDKIFQGFFFKRFNHRNYEDFIITNEKEKVKFLIDFYFYVLNNNFSLSSDIISQNINQNKLVDNIENKNLIREEERDFNDRILYSTSSPIDREIIKKLNNVKNESQKENLKKKMDLFSNENDYKTKLNEIMSKYKNSHKINFSTEINTKEFKNILHTIDNIIKTNENNDSILGDTNYFQTKISKTETFQIKKRKNHNLLIREIIMENFKEPNNLFFSKNNFLEKKDILLKNTESSYSKNNSYLHTNHYKQIKSEISKENKIRKSIGSALKEKTVMHIKDANLVSNQANKNLNISQKEEIFYLGNDLVDMLYNCPTNRLISIDYTNSEKIGLLLLDYIRMEKDFHNLKEEIMKIKEEKENLNYQIIKIKSNEKKKYDLMTSYCNEIRMRFEFNQKLFSEKLNFDNSLILEEINKNIKIFTGNKEENLQNDNVFENNMKKNDSITLLSSSFYTKKKLNKIDKKNIESNI